MAAARFRDQPLDLPYLAIGRTDGQFAVYFYLAGWDVVDGDLLRGLRCVRVAGLYPSRVAGRAARPRHRVDGVENAVE